MAMADADSAQQREIGQFHASRRKNFGSLLPALARHFARLLLATAKIRPNSVECPSPGLASCAKQLHVIRRRGPATWRVQASFIVAVVVAVTDEHPFARSFKDPMTAATKPCTLAVRRFESRPYLVASALHLSVPAEPREAAPHTLHAVNALHRISATDRTPFAAQNGKA
ncbi:uncharacterized protein PAN0_001c0680 [Moesziomyces antarcticus]|uniref:Uncharacterized protein n=1 Tax=Pseudozyma antarctica TaxID=84753 RepID=A0A5C3FF56_PSEA2|nr:uncharacterized protein PAN0_001c0680 [Moesziomyces antarcticus]GAK62480.1 hypothetical protein PAN0_001c0680 [Moesziomyces antarcticus]SPO43033.1 uncharacterized protein PSANT_00717 [Moesziomyces antarcticus]